MAQHSVIGASSKHRWGNCPGSVRLSKGLKPQVSEAAEEGTRVHEIVSSILLGQTTLSFHELMEDEETLYAIRTYINLIEDERKTATLFKIEHPFDMSSFFPGLFGTTDAYGYWEKDRLLRVYDYKHGKGKYVPVEENEQLQYYALGALLSLNFPVDTVELVICQPRCPRRGKVIHRWPYPLFPQTIEFWAELVVQAQRTSEPDAALVLGDWCFFCPAVGFCPKQHEKRLQKAKEEFTAIEN